MTSNLMRMLEPKTLTHKIERMRWSNRMDLIALSTEEGEVIIQRLNLQTLWVHPAPYENARVCGFDWRPDVHILAVGYDSGKIVLIDVENHHILYTQELGTEITHLSWTQCTSDSYDDFDEVQGNTKLFSDAHRSYLTNLPNFNALTSNIRKEDFNNHKPYATRVFNVLMAGTRAGTVQLFVFGMLASGQINVRQTMGALPNEGLHISDVRMSPDFSTVLVWINFRGRFQQLAYTNPLFANNDTIVALLKLTARYGYIVTTQSYIEEIVQCMLEAWETAKQEMERKLETYVNSRPRGVVSADFLNLLMFGEASDNLEDFLENDLTAKGMKRLENSIDITYSTIQKLVVQPLHCAILNMSYHLNYLKGMSKNAYYYKDLIGKISNEGSLNAGSMLIKAFELQQVIEQSRRDYKIFWTWLYNIILFLTSSGDPSPDEICATSQQDTIFLAEFLNTLDDCCQVDSNDRRHIKFNLERVGQYLDNQNLLKPSKLCMASDWKHMLAQNECLRNSDCIYEHHQHSSLIQEHNTLRESIRKIFEKPNALISLKFEMLYNFDICEVNIESPDLLWHNYDLFEQNVTFYSAAVDRKTIYFIEMFSRQDHGHMVKFVLDEVYPDIEKMSLDENVGASTSTSADHQTSVQAQHGADLCSGLQLQHFQYYSESVFCMLFKYRHKNEYWGNCFAQVPIHAIRTHMRHVSFKNRVVHDKDMPAVSLNSILDAEFMRALEFNDGYQIALTSGRKIASVLVNSQKKIYHFETEADKEDDDQSDDEGKIDVCETVSNESDDESIVSSKDDDL